MKTKTREFPALFMTALIALASVCFTGCLRQLITTTPMPKSCSASEDAKYYAPNYVSQQYQASEAPTKKLASRNL